MTAPSTDARSTLAWEAIFGPGMLRERLQGHTGGGRGRALRALLVALAIGLFGLSVIAFGVWSLAAAAAAAAAFALFARPAAGGPLFAAVLILNLPAISVKYYGVPALVAGGASLILLVPVVAAAVQGRSVLVRTAALPWMFVYLLALIVSSIASSAPGEATSNTLVFIVEGAALYLLVTCGIRSEVDLRRVIWTVVLAGGLLGAISISQEARHAYNDDYFGLAQTQAGAIRVSAGVGVTNDRPRLAGPIGETNRYAQIMLGLLPLAMFLVARERRRSLRIVALGCSLAILAAVALTFSRGAILVLGVLLVLMCLAGRIRWRTLIAGGLALTLLASATVPGFTERLDSLRGIAGLFNEDDAGSTPDGAIVGRATSNLAAVGTFVDHPVIGVGPGIYYLDYSRLYANRLGLRYFAENRRAHNMYLEIAADTGIAGLAAFLTICAVTGFGLLRARRIALRRGDTGMADMASALLFALLAFLGTGVFLHLSYERYFWFFVAIANVAMVLISSPNGRPLPRAFGTEDADRQVRRRNVGAEPVAG
jgi:putative inorganic carbon (hco3(-)) transporter